MFKVILAAGVILGSFGGIMGLSSATAQRPVVTTVSPALRNPTLSVTRISPVAISTDVPVGVSFTLTNDSRISPEIRTGIINVSIHKDGSDNNPATVSATSFPVNKLEIGKSVSGFLLVQSPSAGGDWLVEVRYNELEAPVTTGAGGRMGAGIKGRIITVTNKYMAIHVSEDKDGDGIDDNTETALLEKFRPYFMFSDDGGDEDLAPADALWYLTKSELLATGDESKADGHRVVTHAALVADPNAVLFRNGPLGASDLMTNQTFSGYHINPIEKLPGEADNTGRKGEPWSTILSSKNTGLYGHVVSVRLKSPDDFDFAQIQQDGGTDKIYYKIEYWQLFGYNDAHQSLIGNHEGDWASIQLLFDPAANQIVSVFHFAHGVLFRFNMDAARSTNIFPLNLDGFVKEFKGANFTQNLDLAHLGGSFNIVKNEDQIARAQNAILRLFQDPVSKEFCHPVAYISHGTHELFPSEYWKFYGDPNHNGQSYHFLTDTPPNLGEVTFPLNNSPAAQVVLRYNGFWGTFSRYNSPPEGPPLHKNWTWPGDPNSASIRSVIGDHGF